MNQKSKEFEYTVKLLSHLQEIFEEDNENFIDMKEMQESDSATAFIHALATLVPSQVYEQLTGDKTDVLGFNQIANRLVFQFSKITE